jgi:hypothetical protein
MHGSPTLLVNGIDPFAPPGSPASVSCRIYRDESGRIQPGTLIKAHRRRRQPGAFSQLRDPQTVHGTERKPGTQLQGQGAAREPVNRQITITSAESWPRRGAALRDLAGDLPFSPGCYGVGDLGPRGRRGGQHDAE